jgi:phosphoglycolate phosphatase
VLNAAATARYDLLVFDWDGTIVDSTGHIAASLQASFADLGLPVPTDEAARHVIGLGLQDALTYLHPGLPASRFAEVTDRYRYHFLAGDSGIACFPGVTEGIASLNRSGYLLAVATGKSRRGLDRSMQSLALAEHFHGSRCADEGFPKPHPDMLETLMETLGVRPERTLMIGDTTHDLQMAANAGVGAVAVTYGAHAAEDLRALNPVASVASFGEFMRWLKTTG